MPLEAAVQHVRLVPLTPAYRELFFEEELVNYADEHVRDAGWEPETALEQVRLRLGPVLERELEQAAARKQRLWKALSSAGRARSGLDEDYGRFGEYAVVLHRVGRALRFHSGHQGVHVGDIHHHADASAVLRVDERADVPNAEGADELLALG